ncbi:diaminobutyrate-2-oxoglutarate transaminase [Desulfurispira natronophila]|uniref:Diaminobutyrate--2-oxoglutarate transaminase n=2 Tax=Desulfurispira natronophila TaxID=682562 RepID=A0A7W7Y3U3_9BACT|nr:diaminobutyrate-2-oxoglutarate transaminase [Desulfurispira natronophila]
MESEVRGYIRSFPAIFERAKGAMLVDEQGNEFVDFFAGAGTLNYGHNNDRVSKALVEYIQNDGVVHGLDMATSAKKRFLQTLYDVVLSPRNYEYKVQFTGPTGTNTVESALKLARMIKGRSNVVAFTNAFHGLTMGSLAITGNNFYRDEAHISRSNVSFMPYDGYFGPDVNTLDYFRKFLEDGSSGLDLPSAVIVETIQAEGGINVASDEWLQGLEQICREFDILLIIDEIQVGNGRSGEFFSFERSGITPDMVTLSKSIGGGLPLALLLMRPELDQWKPGEHTGTFRGNNLAFVASVETLAYWENNDLSDAIHYKSGILKEELEALAVKYPDLNASVRGRGLIYGFEIPEIGIAKEVSRIAFEKGLIIELSGASDQVVKFLPPLTIDEETLRKGIGIIDETIGEILETKQERLSEEF